MTLRELSQLYWLKKEIANQQARLAELESRAHGIASSSGGGMPHGSEPGRKTERYAMAIAEARQTIEDNLARCQEERARLEAYIAGIDDSLTREIYRLRFVDCLSWEQVAAKVGNYSPSSVKSICYRYLKAS